MADAGADKKDDELKECTTAKADCDAAYKECEDAIKECEDAALSCRYLLSVCVVVIILLGSLLVYLNAPYSGKSSNGELRAYYLMPPSCRDCDTYVVKQVSSELGVRIDTVVSDGVQKPMLQVFFGNKSTVGTARTRLNILATLCSFAGNAKACSLVNASVTEPVACLGRYDVSPDTVIFFTQSGCDYCESMKAWVRELRDDGYLFRDVDVFYKNDKEIADACLSGLLDVDGVVPQFVCPASGVAKVGAFASKEEMKEFADACRRA